MTEQLDLFAAPKPPPRRMQRERDPWSRYTDYFYLRARRMHPIPRPELINRIKQFNRDHILWPRNPNRLMPVHMRVWRWDRGIDWPHRYRMMLAGPRTDMQAVYDYRRLRRLALSQGSS
jgi:hypothetical protein